MEPKQGVIGYGSGAGGFDALEHFLVFHASLTVYNLSGELEPRLVEKMPRLEDDDWKVLPDGRMEVRWRLRKDAEWHDGVPLTAEDFVFGFQARMDPDLPNSPSSFTRFISGLRAPDPHTVAVDWSQPWYQAGGSGPSDLTALPRHLIADIYQSGDKQAFMNNPYWTTEFVGLGPFKLARWQLGSFVEGVAFDHYVLGRPRIERVILTYGGDVNTIVAGVLAGDLDVVPKGARFDAGQLTVVRDGWGPDGGLAILDPTNARTVHLQLRDPAAPWARDVRVRQALAHASDRQGMSDALQYGLAEPAHTFVRPDDPTYRILRERGYARYSFDPTRARQLLAAAGWVASPDGILREPGGQALALDLSATGQGGNVQEIEALSQQWQNAGIQASPMPLPPQAANLDELKNNFRGGFVWPLGGSTSVSQSLTSAQIPNERNRWKGNNYGGYSSVVYDRLYDRFGTTLDAAEREGVVVESLQLLAQELPVIPIYFYGNAVIARKGLTGVGLAAPSQSASAWNIHTWELD
jgi:peptide/nickel transport system substrate-binding protein